MRMIEGPWNGDERKTTGAGEKTQDRHRWDVADERELVSWGRHLSALTMGGAESLQPTLGSPSQSPVHS